MPSIFIWKAITTSTTSNTSKKMIKIYSGSNWVLEENESCSISKSYIYLDQIVISKSDDLLITFHTKNMPLDWVGSDLLEVSYVPYEIIKSDNYGTLEMIGEWMRFTKNNEIELSCKLGLATDFKVILFTTLSPEKLKKSIEEANNRIEIPTYRKLIFENIFFI